MAICTHLIGRWLPHRCGRQTAVSLPPLQQGRCSHCGALVITSEPMPPLDFDTELEFSGEELRRFGLLLEEPGGGANPPEWSVEPFSDFT